MSHQRHKTIVLVGDSMLDTPPTFINFVARCPTLLEVFNGEIKKDNIPITCIMRAVCGSVINDVYSQINNIDGEISHLFLSVGGNDICRKLLELKHCAGWSCLTYILCGFREQYRDLVMHLKARFPNTQIILCNLVSPNYPWRVASFFAGFGSRFINSQIHNVASELGLRVLDTFHTMSDRGDYADDVHPSPQGAHQLCWQIINMTRFGNFKSGVGLPRRSSIELTNSYYSNMGFYKFLKGHDTMHTEHDDMLIL